MTVMLVVLFVARNATGVQLVGEWLFTVALTTREVCMTAIQRKTRVALMIKTGVIPRGRAVTIAAILTAQAVMRVILCVA